MSLLKARARTESCRDHNNRTKMAAGQGSRQRDRSSASLLDPLSVNHCRRSSGCLVEIPLAGLTAISPRELSVSEASGSPEQDLNAAEPKQFGKCDTKSLRIPNRLLISSCFHPALPPSV